MRRYMHMRQHLNISKKQIPSSRATSAPQPIGVDFKICSTILYSVTLFKLVWYAENNLGMSVDTSSLMQQALICTSPSCNKLSFILLPHATSLDLYFSLMQQALVCTSPSCNKLWFVVKVTSWMCSGVPKWS